MENLAGGPVTGGSNPILITQEEFSMINWGYIFLNNQLYRWAEGLAAALVILMVFGLLKWLIRRRASLSAALHVQSTGTLANTLLDHTPWLFILWLAIFVFLRFLILTPIALNVVETITIIVLLIQIGLWSIQLIEFWLTRRQGPAGAAEISDKKGPVRVILLLAKIVVWIVVVILALENIPGIHITTLIASLGIGGIAIGLALQRVLGDLFASLTISIDQPFVEGDAISVDQFSGTVEHIGLKSTRVRSGTGEQLIFSNSDLLESRIHNYKRMDHRLVIFTLNITYDTPHKKLQKIPKIIKGIIEAHPQIIFNRAHFKGFDPSSLIFEVVYTVKKADFNLYMDLQQEINLEIIRQFDEDGISFAYPTQTVFVNK
jgi:small-conductance mechanosensitive channel